MNYVLVKSWTTEAGLAAYILLVNETHHCGYVESPSELEKVNEGDLSYIKVHGGLTYSGYPDWSNGKYVFGYDCSHLGDLMKCPSKFKGTSLEHLSMYSTGTWRDESYCTLECERLAKQLIDLAPNVLTE